MLFVEPSRWASGLAERLQKLRLPRCVRLAIVA
jgi:hypothetical protein